jgi:Flp pilus assembly protein TadG
MRAFFNCKGQSMVEIAVISPLILVALYVAFDFGIAIFTSHITQNAVRDGSRIGSTTSPLDDAAAANLAAQVYNTLPQMLVSGTASPKRVTVTHYTGGAAHCAQNVEVRAEGTYNFALYRLIVLVGMPAPAPIQISRTTTMRYEFQPDFYGGTASTVDICTTATASGTHP